MLSGSEFVAVAEARFYFRDPKKISHSRLYLIAADGGRKAIGKGRDPFWISPNQIGWIKDAAGRNTRKRAEIWELDLPSFKRRRVFTGRKVTLEDGDLIEAGGKTYQLSPKGLVPRKLTPEKPFKISDARDSLIWRGKTYRIENPGVRWEAWDGEKGQPSLSQVGTFAPDTNAIQNGRFSFVTGSVAYTAHIGTALLFRLDSIAGTARVLPQPGAVVRFDSGGQRFLATSGRCLDRLGALTVWATKLYLGSLPDGNYREIPLPTCYIDSVSLRPYTSAHDRR